MAQAAIGEMVTRVCHCGKQFSFPRRGRGLARTNCSSECRESRKLVLKAQREMDAPRCDIDGCTEKALNVSGGMCIKHRTRVKRTGSTDARPLVGQRVIDRGYVLVRAEGHPMAKSDAMAYQHRVVMYDSFHGQCPPCFWCGVQLEWKTLVVDHLNEVKSDNRLENLLPSCSPCNRARGAMLPFVKRMSGDSFPLFVEAMERYRVMVNG